MADILIKGMELPKDCRYCPCVRFDKEYGIISCRAVYDNHNDEDVVARDYDEWDMLDTTRSKPLVKPSWCPLVALPEHGELKDYNDILKIFDKVLPNVDDATNELLCDLLVQIMYAPTVIPSSDSAVVLERTT